MNLQQKCYLIFISVIASVAGRAEGQQHNSKGAHGTPYAFG